MKILIAEDDFICRTIIRRLLEPYADCDEVINGMEALTAFTIGVVEGDPHDLILLDVMMPEMDGHEVLEEVRRIEEEEWGIIYPKGVKIIMTTALDDPRNVVKSFKFFCDAYLVKPITEKKLIAAIQEFFPDFGT